MSIREMSTSLPIALVTGASWSIDAASTILLVQQGYLVFINYGLNNSAALKVCQSVTEQAGSAQICGADVSTKEGITSLYAGIDPQAGSLSILFGIFDA